MDVKALSFSLKPYIERNGNSDLGVYVRKGWRCQRSHGCFGFTVWCVPVGHNSRRLKGTAAAASQQQRGGGGGNGSLNSALKQEATLVLSLLCFYRLNFLSARPPPLPRLQSLLFMGWIVKILQWQKLMVISGQSVTIRAFVVEEKLKCSCRSTGSIKREGLKCFLWR